MLSTNPLATVPERALEEALADQNEVRQRDRLDEAQQESGEFMAVKKPTKKTQAAIKFKRVRVGKKKR